ncbi:MAG: hypothetical protein KDE32_01435 [Novosphingobium sp.]|nr:hypothetical protein [Novosphingobium sp.]
MNQADSIAVPQVDRAALAKASGTAVAVAAVVLTLFVLPAEYGIDPTGAGRALGLTGMSDVADTASPGSSAVIASAVAATPDKATIARTGTLREDEMTIELAPHSGKEIKAHMGQGDSFVFEWASKGGPVKVDMHGEHPDAAEGEFTSYWKERELDQGKGVFTAPFEGTHGWYWRNKGETPVSVTVRVAGFYKDLFEPAGD